MKRIASFIALLGCAAGLTVWGGVRCAHADPPERDYYVVLGVERGAGDQEIKSNYRKLAIANHPDRHPGDLAAEDRFKEAQEAFAVLSDPAKRTMYDSYGQRYGAEPNKGPLQPQAMVRWQDYLQGTSLEGVGPIALQALQLVAEYRGTNLKVDLPAVRQFTTPFQLAALQAALPYRRGNIEQDYGALLKFTNENQVIALRMVVNYRKDRINEDYAALLKFNLADGVDAIGTVLARRQGEIGQDLATLAKFDDPELVRRLRAEVREKRTDIQKYYQSIYDDTLKERKAAHLSKLKFEKFWVVLNGYESIRYPISTLEQEALTQVARENLEKVFVQGPSEPDLLRFATAAKIPGDEARQKYYAYMREKNFSILRLKVRNYLEEKYKAGAFESYQDFVKGVPSYSSLTGGQEAGVRAFIEDHADWFGELRGLGVPQIRDLERYPIMLPQSTVYALFRKIAPNVQTISEARTILAELGRHYRGDAADVLVDNYRRYLRLGPSFEDLKDWLWYPRMEPEAVAAIAEAALWKVSTPDEWRRLTIPRSAEKNAAVIVAADDARYRIAKIERAERLACEAREAAKLANSSGARRTGGFWSWGND